MVSPISTILQNNWGFEMLLRRVAVCCLVVANAWAADQSKPGEGNQRAMQLAADSPLVESARVYLMRQASRIQDAKLRANTQELLTNSDFCIASRVGVTAERKDELLKQLLAEGLLAPGMEKAAFTGVFPVLRDEAAACPKMPQSYGSAPGSSFGGHHSHPGGLALHAAFNLTNGLQLARGYRQIYGSSRVDGMPVVAAVVDGTSDVFLSEDLMIAAPIWHDWAKIMVFQWNADGTEFSEFNFGGNGKTDAWGGAGDSRTGAHHILGAAEGIMRGLPAEFVITVMSAHAAPTGGNEYKVVNWIRTASILAGVDPVAAGYLKKDSQGRFRLAALRRLGEKSNLLSEYVLHHLSDADFVFTGPAATTVDQLLKELAQKFGVDRTNITTFNNQFRNPVLAYLSVERLMLLYGNGGMDAVEKEIQTIRSRLKL